MHRTRRILPHALLPLLLLPVAACDDGESRPLARPDQLKVTIIRGVGMHVPVRDPATPEGDPGLAPEPVIARVAVALDAEEEQELGITGPGMRVPPVEIRWHTIESHFCKAEHAVTPVQGDTAVNHFVRPTRSGVCRLVAEGVIDGRVFAVDTAVASFHPGPAVRFRPTPILAIALQVKVPIPDLLNAPEDAWGNAVTSRPPWTAEVTAGPPAIIRVDTMLVATREGTGNLRLTVGPDARNIALWSLRTLSTHWWTLGWTCYDLQLPGGAHVDSAHFRMDSVRAYYGALSARGVNATLEGGMRRRMWVRGEPPRDAVFPVSRHVAQRPGVVMWDNGQVSAADGPMALRYDGGNLCEAPPEGGAWARHAPVWAVRGDSIRPEDIDALRR